MGLKPTTLVMLAPCCNLLSSSQLMLLIKWKYDTGITETQFYMLESHTGNLEQFLGKDVFCSLLALAMASQIHFISYTLK